MTHANGTRFDDFKEKLEEGVLATQVVCHDKHTLRKRGEFTHQNVRYEVR